MKFKSKLHTAKEIRTVDLLAALLLSICFSVNLILTFIITDKIF